MVSQAGGVVALRFKELHKLFFLKTKAASELDTGVVSGKTAFPSAAVTVEYLTHIATALGVLQ